MTSRVTLILGGVRSGKSRAALALAEAARGEGRSLFVATGEALDDEMRRRIDTHRRERGDRWDTLEAPLDLATGLDAFLSTDVAHGVVVIDCLTLWVSNVLLTLGEDDDAEDLLAARTSALVEVIARHSAAEDGAPARQWVIVSNEVGLGVVPPTALGRRYRDALGRTNQIVAQAADRVVLMVAGLSLDLKNA